MDIATAKALEDGLDAGDADLRILGVRAAAPLHRGVPILLDGRIIGGIGSIGGIGVSGVMASQDEIVAMAGAAAVAVAVAAK